MTTWTHLIQIDEDDGWFVAKSASLPNCYIFGGTAEEVRAKMVDAIPIFHEVLSTGKGLGDFRVVEVDPQQHGASLLRFVVHLYADTEGGGYVADCVQIPGCVVGGDTENEALEEIKDAISLCIEIFAELDVTNRSMHLVDISIQERELPNIPQLKRRDSIEQMLSNSEGRGKGSGRIFMLPDGTTVPSAGGRKDVSPGVQRNIVRRIGISVKEWLSLVLVLVALAIGIPVLVVFGDGGPFNELFQLPSEGTLSDNSYSGILAAIIGLIPLTSVAFIATKFTGLNVRKSLRRLWRRKRK